MKYGHLERISATLRMLSPVFIGSGGSMKKKEYIFDTRTGKIHFPELSRLIVFLKQHSLLSAYEQFLTNPRQNDFQAFLTEKKIGPSDYQNFVLYTIDAGEAVRANNFREVLTFIKDISGQPYIPGSSLKGAIRTAIAAWLIRKGDWERDRGSIERADTNMPPRRYLKRESDNLEKRVFYRLERKDRRGEVSNDAVNDLMQGIRISDSRPIGFDCLTLTGKYDRKPDGTVKPLPIFRECLIPGCEAGFEITLDLPILAKAGISSDDIENALHRFADEHYANFEQQFKELPEDAPIAAQHGVDVILGGGAGYVSKTLTYNLFSYSERAVRMVSRIMAKNFSQHRHESDVSRYKVSPHILKTTIYKEMYYPMGRCELIWR